MVIPIFFIWLSQEDIFWVLPFVLEYGPSLGQAFLLLRHGLAGVSNECFMCSGGLSTLSVPKQRSLSVHCDLQDLCFCSQLHGRAYAVGLAESSLVHLHPSPHSKGHGQPSYRLLATSSFMQLHPLQYLALQIPTASTASKFNLCLFSSVRLPASLECYFPEVWFSVCLKSESQEVHVTYMCFSSLKNHCF